MDRVGKKRVGIRGVAAFRVSIDVATQVGRQPGGNASDNGVHGAAMRAWMLRSDGARPRGWRYRYPG